MDDNPSAEARFSRTVLKGYAALMAGGALYIMWPFTELRAGHLAVSVLMTCCAITLLLRHRMALLLYIAIVGVFAAFQLYSLATLGMTTRRMLSLIGSAAALYGYRILHDDLRTSNKTSGEPTSKQLARFHRCETILERLAVPTYAIPLCVLDDDDAFVRKSGEVRVRILILWVLSQLGEGIMPKAEALEILRECWTFVSPAEQKFSQAHQVLEDENRQAVWGLEAVWTLMWANGWLADLPLPSKMCDVEELVNQLNARLRTETGLIRDKSEILDALQQTMLIHWALRDAHLNQRAVPLDLNWKSEDKWAPATLSPAMGVVEQRHKALKWLVSGEDWDFVDTST